jgi:acyl-CoA hydrolase
MPTGQREVTLRFLAAPTDAGHAGHVGGGRVLEWIDKAGYACAVGWSGAYCVTAYVGNVRFRRPVPVGHLVEATASLVHTGRSSMHILVTVSSADPADGVYAQTTRCLVIFVAVDSHGRPSAVPAWHGVTAEDRELQHSAVRRIGLRADIEAAMAGQRYTDAGTAHRSTLRFLAAPTDVNWGGKVHGGTVMRWIDEAAYVCSVGWVHGPCTAVYAGGIRFYRPLLIGHVVEVEARLLHTGRTSLHVAVHVRSGDPRTASLELTTHCLFVFVALGPDGRPTPAPPWRPRTAEDEALDQHARDLVSLRSGVESAGT